MGCLFFYTIFLFYTDKLVWDFFLNFHKWPTTILSPFNEALNLLLQLTHCFVLVQAESFWFCLQRWLSRLRRDNNFLFPLHSMQGTLAHGSHNVFWLAAVHRVHSTLYRLSTCDCLCCRLKCQLVKKIPCLKYGTWNMLLLNCVHCHYLGVMLAETECWLVFLRH